MTEISQEHLSDIKNRLDNHSVPEPNSGCFLWTGFIDRLNGYGKLNYGGRCIGAHRLAYAAYKGIVPPRSFVCHSCDTPSCVNPDHLFLGTNSDNVTDRHKKGRTAYGEMLSKLTIKQIAAIKSASGNQTEIGQRFGISQSQVSRIKLGQTWKHLNG